jgi:putative RNA 2'-phosphotransferase
MPSEKEITHISKFLSLVLRHKPDTIGITLDESGWADVNELIEKTNKYGLLLTEEILMHVVATNAKKRFAFNESLTKIRASQGHSVAVDLGYQPQQPPSILYHGTSEDAVAAILQSGLEKRSRQHVHLSSDIGTAGKVGQRHGKVFIFTVAAEEMYRDGFVFFISENGVWLTDNVPAKYLRPF